MKWMIRNIEEIICAISLIFMTGITFINVIARYIFSASLSFSEEITSYMFVLLTLLGAAVATKRRAHLGLTILTDAVSPQVKRVLEIISSICAIGFSGILFWYGCSMTANQFIRGQVTAGMQFPEWIFGSFVPIGAFFVTIRFLQILIQDIQKEVPKKEAKV